MRVLRNGLLAIAGSAAILYALDDLYARFRHAPFADIHIDRYLAVAEKFNKISYERTTSITQRCVYSIFPHFGYRPCWYVTRHTLQFIKIG
jgi:hypothetical protein